MGLIMKKFKVTATIYTDVFIEVYAEDEDAAYEEARNADGGDWTEENDGMSGDFRIDNIYELEDE